jgi:hypothetical protein
VLGDDREVAEDEPQRQVVRDPRAVRALIVAVLDDEPALAADVVVRLRLRRLGAG